MIINYDINNRGGGASAEGCVRYDQQQELTDEQKSTARENIGAISDSDIPDPVQSDWNENDSDDPAYIKNKPTIPTVNNPTVIIKQGDAILGSFSLNQAGGTFITLEGSGVYREPVSFDTDGIPQLTYTYINYLTLLPIETRRIYVFYDQDMSIGNQPKDFILVGILGLGHLVLTNGEVFVDYQTNGSTVLRTVRPIPTVNDPTITINQGGETKGSFTLNQSGASTINLDGGSAEGCLRYDEAQDLTEEQQEQARENIGAAGVRLIELEGQELEDMTAEEFLSIYGSLSLGCEAFVLPRGMDSTRHKLLAERSEMTRTYDNLFLYFLNSDGTIEEICRRGNLPEDSELEFRKLGAAENHQLLKSALSEAMGCQANTWHTLCEVTVPEDGVYQVSASVCAQPATETSYSAVIVGIATRTGSGNPTEHQEIQLPRSGEYGIMSVPVNATAGQKIQLLAYSSSNFYAQAVPSAGKASATFISAVRIGATYTE